MLTTARFGFGIVGLGTIAACRARAVRAMRGGRLTCLFSHSGSERARALAEAFDVPLYVKDYAAFLAHPGLHIVTIATPSGAHLEPTVAAAQAGKHVICEKPLEITLERCDRMIAACRQAGVQLGGIFPSRTRAAVQALRQALAVASLTQHSLHLVGRMLAGTTNAILGILSQGLLVLLFLVFLLLGGTTQTQMREGVWGEIESRVERYILTKLLVSAVTGVLVGAILMALGIELALVFGLFAFLLNFVPNVGSIIATLLPLPAVLISPEVSTLTAVLAIALPALVQFTIGNVVEPKIMGMSLDLHPVTIIVALIVWGMLWGVAGMLLATPTTAVLKILFERLEVTTPVAELLAGRLGTLKSA